MRFTAFPPPPPHPITLIFAPFAETCTTRLARCRCVGFLAASRNRRRSDTAMAPPRVNPLVRIVPAALIGTVRSALCRRARHHAQRNQMKSLLQQTPLVDGLKLKKVTEDLDCDGWTAIQVPKANSHRMHKQLQNENTSGSATQPSIRRSRCALSKP